MCIEINAEDFVTVHHELGHNFYQRAYNQQPFLYRTGANDGFHEAIGDAVALSITPQYLVKIGLLPTAPKTQDDVEFLLRMALDKVAFLPFGLLVDQWRWKVFSGEIPPAQYNAAWWELREKYQGVAAPGPRPADAFDPGAKYHVPANTPYTRYFLAHILQFQMHRAMCKAAGHTGPLHTCSIYGNKEVGARLQKMLAMGASKPWPEALEALTGEKQMDATAILEYFAPLRDVAGGRGGQVTRDKGRSDKEVKGQGRRLQGTRERRNAGTRFAAATSLLHGPRCSGRDLTRTVRDLAVLSIAALPITSSSEQRRRMVPARHSRPIAARRNFDRRAERGGRICDLPPAICSPCAPARSRRRSKPQYWLKLRRCQAERVRLCRPSSRS